jgi:hypothetical protein
MTLAKQFNAKKAIMQYMTVKSMFVVVSMIIVGWFEQFLTCFPPGNQGDFNCIFIHQHL